MEGLIIGTYRNCYQKVVAPGRLTGFAKLNNSKQNDKITMDVGGWVQDSLNFIGKSYLY